MILVNLSNHPVATWPATQLEAAIELGFSQAIDWPDGIPSIDPNASSEHVARVAQELAKKVGASGAAAAFVAGEYVFAFSLIAALQPLGVRCFSATSNRISEESRGENGSLRRTVTYEFVQWREYPLLTQRL